jgi:hypothetical protein
MLQHLHGVYVVVVVDQEGRGHDQLNERLRPTRLHAARAPLQHVR